jgi:hypothetical protein
MDLGGELLDDVGVTATEARDDLGDELLLFRCELTHACQQACEGHATESAVGPAVG